MLRKDDTAHALKALLALMQRLRDPERGCPWDRRQDFCSIAPHTVEEAYELAEAIEDGTPGHVREEVGDLLFQVVFYCQMGQEAGYFDFASVANALRAKLIARHPHLFRVDADPVAWEGIKAEERARRAERAGKRARLLDGVCRHLPALSRAVRLQRRAASVGFDWSQPGAVLEKLAEELDELRAALREGGGADAVEEELGDVLFVCANLARHLGCDPEAALRAANRKFERRFAYVEDRLAERDRTPADSSLQQMERYWNEAKHQIE